MRKKHDVRSLALPRTQFSPSLLSILLAVIMVATLGMMSISQPAKASPAVDSDARAPQQTGPELLPNGDFAQGTSGWRTNGTHAHLSMVPNSTNPIAQLTTRSTGHAVLNDAPNVVSSTTRGSSYTVTARVRTSTPDVPGALRIREVSGGQARSSETTFRLTDTQWQTVELNVTSTFAQSHLDLNLVAWNLPPGQNLQIDWVSLKQVGLQAPQPPPSQCDVAPPAGTSFGSSVSTVGMTLEESLNDIDTAFGRVPVVRHFSPGLPFNWDSRAAQQLRGREIVVSFKVHPTQITSGRHDSFFRDWFASAPSDQTIYWSYFHEPENDINRGAFTAAQYRAAWARLGQLHDEACRPNMFSTLTLTEWTMNPRSGRDYRTYDAGPQAVDVIAFDPYNGIHDPTRDYYITPEALMDHIVEKMANDGRPWAIAEIGSRIAVGDNGSGRAAWLRDVAEYATANDALFVTYYQTNRAPEWRLDDSRSRSAWRQAVQGG